MPDRQLEDSAENSWLRDDEVEMDRHKQEEGKPDYKPEDSGSAQGEPNRVWQTVTDPTTGEVTVTNPEDDPWDSDHLLELPNGARPVNPGQDLLETYVAMVIEERCKDRDFSDKEALDRCMEDVRTSITCVLGWIEASAPADLSEERNHRLTMEQLQGIPVEMLDLKYNLYRMENQGINLEEHPEYRSYQAFHEMGVITPPTHEQMANIIIAKPGRPSEK